jgi:hypothetical protein
MFCTACGAKVPEGSSYCSSCGRTTRVETPPVVTPPAQPAGPAPSIPSYLAQSILVTIFCCLPFGIVAIVYASQVNTKLAVGDFVGARESSNKAKTFCWVSFALCVPALLLYAVVAILAGMDV